MENILEIFIGCIIPLLTSGILCLHRKTLPKELTLIISFCMLQSLGNMFVMTFIKTFSETLSVYFLFERVCFLIIFYLFTKIFIGAKRANYILLIILFFGAILLFSRNKFFGNSSSISLLECVVIVGLSCLYFYSTLLKKTEHIEIPDSSIYWSLSGIFIYYTGYFISILSYNYLLATDEKSIAVLWQFKNVLLCICCIYICYGTFRKSLKPILG